MLLFLTAGVALALVPAGVSLVGPPSAQVGLPYGAALAAFGGTPPYTLYGIASGTLPPGINLDRPTGAIAGTPTTAGAFTFVPAVSDSNEILTDPVKAAPARRRTSAQGGAMPSPSWFPRPPARRRCRLRCGWP